MFQQMKICIHSNFQSLQLYSLVYEKDMQDSLGYISWIFFFLNIHLTQKIVFAIWKILRQIKVS